MHLIIIKYAYITPYLSPVDKLMTLKNDVNLKRKIIIKAE